MTASMTPGSALFDALMAREDMFDRLIALDPRLAKFHRVLVDEHTARRLTLADAAAMLGIHCRDLMDLANGRDLEALSAVADASEDCRNLAETRPTEVVDACALFETGHEPLPAILDAADRTPLSEAFAVTAPFDPVPLRRLMSGRGYATWTQTHDGLWRVTFMKQA